LGIFSLAISGHSILPNAKTFSPIEKGWKKEWMPSVPHFMAQAIVLDDGKIATTTSSMSGME
jgi:hypothetical protein